MIKHLKLGMIAKDGYKIVHFQIQNFKIYGSKNKLYYCLFFIKNRQECYITKKTGKIVNLLIKS